LLSGVERVALGADFYMQVFGIGGTCLEGIAATADYLDFSVLWVDVGFHS